MAFMMYLFFFLCSIYCTALKGAVSKLKATTREKGKQGKNHKVEGKPSKTLCFGVLIFAFSILKH